MLRASQGDAVNEEFDGVARIDRRLEARRLQVRSKLETVPELAGWLDQVREVFGNVRLTYLEIDDWRHGEPLPPGIVPAPYHRPQATRRGKAEALRARERVGR